ncbi:VQ motif-containing protein [Corchorus olitorius]|uniref:VQ motif-containing protein n=1 Tax=Corchorus olitorius TaxID=93759 RepID=A0A1R3HED5_9ROSI|nr:VQ motif-containing protein [Corchorus olitorius]
MSSSRGIRELQGPRPTPLKVSNTSSKIIKKSSTTSHQAPKNIRSKNIIDPVVIYLRSPKIIHVRPEEFMSLVQRLTGKDSTTATTTDHIHQISYPSSPSSSGDVVADESMADIKLNKDYYKMFDGDGDGIMAKTSNNNNNNEVDFADQILGMSPTWLRFLACV